MTDRFRQRTEAFMSWQGVAMVAPLIEPIPPQAGPNVGLPWDVDTADPVATLAAARSELGDTFVVDSGPDRWLFTFSPVGVASFYRLAEEVASKGVADWRMLRRKVPNELFIGRRMLPHELFGRDDVQMYMANLDTALDEVLGAKGGEVSASGELDVFAFTRRLGHRLGLASWGGPGAASGDRFERLVAAFDQLDGSEAFVHPNAMAAVKASGKAAEYAALAEIENELTDALQELPNQITGEHQLFARIAQRWADASQNEQARGVAYDVALIHIASMSNMAAALGWALVDLLEHSESYAKVAAADRELAERGALESIRMSQRSVMARHVLEAVDFDIGDRVLRVDPGVTIATLLPLTNTSAGDGLDHWDPARWDRRRLRNAPSLETPELVTTFGHGRHSCPAQPFSLAAMCLALTRLTSELDMTPNWREHPAPVQAQIGGIARADQPCIVSYRRAED